MKSQKCKKKFLLLPYLRYTARRILRKPCPILLMSALLAMFITAIGWMRWTMQCNDEKIENLYNEIVVEGDILPENTMDYLLAGGGIIPHFVVDALEESGYISALQLVAGFEAEVATKDEWEGIPRVLHDEVDFRAVRKFEEFISMKNNGIFIEYMEDYDDGVFEAAVNDADVIILSAKIMEQWEISLGDRIVVIPKNFDAEGLARYYTVVGKFVSMTNDFQGIMPLYTLEKMVEQENINYYQVHYTIKTEKNRTLDYLKVYMTNVLEKQRANIVTGLNHNLQDNELKQAITPLEKRNDLIRILYPLSVVLSIVIFSLIVFLSILISFKDMALLRVLGTSKGHVKFIICIEQWLIYLLGMFWGIGLLTVLFGIDSLAVFTGMHVAGGCIGGGIISSLLCTIIMLKRKPMEYLQVKE